jgi:hypothetical protein
MTVRPRLYADTASELSSLPDLSPRDGPTSAHRTRPAALSNAVVNSAGHAQSTRSQRQALVAGKPAAARPQVRFWGRSGQGRAVLNRSELLQRTPQTPETERRAEGARPVGGEVHYMIQPLVELYGGCMVVLKVS